MNIRPKNAILFALTGVKFSLNNLGGANWRQQVFNNYRQHLLDLLASYGQDDNYGYWLNDMQSRHALIYDMANKSGDWQKTAYKNDLVGQYQHDYKGDLRFGTYNPGNNYQTDFNLLGIVKALEQNRYDISGPKRTSGDYGNHDFLVDNLYSAITDDRRLLGRKGDWDENSEEFKTWQKDLNSRGWETYLDTTDNYYKIRRLKDSLNAPPSDTTQQLTQKQNGVLVGAKDDTPNDFWSKLLTGFKNIAPDLLDALRLAGNMHNNERVYNESMKAIIPNLLLSYHTYRQVVGDEATKLAYYRRAVQGQTKAGLPFTSDADRLMAYMQEARRIGDELRAQGDLADNQRIRETSAEAAAHADANIERDTTIANQNITELNKAAAAKHQLTAQKYSADWTNIDLYLLGWQARLLLKKARLEAVLDLIDLLTMLDGIYEDPAYRTAYTNLLAIVKKHTNSSGEIDYNNQEVIDAQRALQKAKNNYLINYYRTKKAKSGTKITKKDTTDKYLYRTSRDIVEHFRRMSKMTDDSRVRTMPKAAKMPSHPKKKLLLGGIAPFTVYRPLGVGGETTTQVSLSTDGTSKSTKDTAAKDKLDMIKEMFKAVQSTGLPVDVNVVYRDINNLFQKAKLFGEELSSDDIATIYLQSMLKISNLKYSKENYDKAMAVATSNESLNEFAVDAAGNYLVLDLEGNFSKVKSLAEIKEKGLNPVTNLQLLNLRAYSTNMAFQRGDYMLSDIINNGMGINKIGALIKALAGSLGSTEGKLEGISQVESGKVKAGLLILAGAPDGYYKITTETKSLKEQVNAALSYIENMLSPALRAILEIHGGTRALIKTFLSSQEESTLNVSILPLTGKASKDDKESLDKISSNPLLAMLREIGGTPINYSLITRDSNTRISVNGTSYSALPKVDTDMSISKMLSTSGIDGIITNRRGITLGDLQIKPEDLNHIMYSIDGGGTIVTLPCKIVNGVKQVNLDVKEQYEKAEQYALLISLDRTSPLFIKALGEGLKKEHLDSLLDSNGLPNKNMFALFLLVEAYTTDKIDFKKDSQYIEKVQNPDASLEQRMIQALSNDKKKPEYGIDIKDHWGIFEGFYDDVYRGTMFIPLNNNPNAAINSWGGSVNISLSTELEELYQNANKSSKFNNNNSL